jgi:hypothetical protein
MIDKETYKGLEHLLNTSSDLTDIDLSIAILTNNMGPDFDREAAKLLVFAIEKKKLLSL